MKLLIALVFTFISSLALASPPGIVKIKYICGSYNYTANPESFVEKGEFSVDLIRHDYGTTYLGFSKEFRLRIFIERHSGRTFAELADKTLETPFTTEDWKTKNQIVVPLSTPYYDKDFMFKINYALADGTMVGLRCKFQEIDLNLEEHRHFSPDKSCGTILKQYSH